MKTIIKTIFVLIIIAGVVWGATYLIGNQAPQSPIVQNPSGEVSSSTGTPQPTQAIVSNDEKIKELTYETYEREVLGSEKRIVIDFYATWCDPCKLLSPIIEDVVKNYDNVKLLKVDIDKETELVEYFGITAAPTTVIMEKGEVKSKTLGLMPREKLIELINYDSNQNI